MAKKKYYQSMKDRRDESRGMDEYEHRKNRERYQEDDMIREDKSAVANLPQDVKMKEYPRFRYGLNEYLDDTIKGADEQIYDDMDQMKKHLSKEKY
jgi:hypothetical protein